MGEKRAKASGSPVQASVGHQQPTNRLRVGENDDEVKATNKTCGWGEALDVEVVSHRYERMKGEKEHELEQRFQPSDTRIFTNDQRAQNEESRKRAQVHRGRKEMGDSGRGRSRRNRLGDSSPRPRLQTSSVMSMKKTRWTRDEPEQPFDDQSTCPRHSPNQYITGRQEMRTSCRRQGAWGMGELGAVVGK